MDSILKLAFIIIDRLRTTRMQVTGKISMIRGKYINIKIRIDEVQNDRGDLKVKLNAWLGAEEKNYKRINKFTVNNK